jgi:ankyrin repeat protein
MLSREPRRRLWLTDFEVDMRSCFSGFFRSQLRRLTAVALMALAWSVPAFCDEIHDAARSGDLQKLKTLLGDNPHLVFSKDNIGLTPLHEAALWGRKRCWPIRPM